LLSMTPMSWEDETGKNLDQHELSDGSCKFKCCVLGALMDAHLLSYLKQLGFSIVLGFRSRDYGSFGRSIDSNRDQMTIWLTKY